MDPIKYLRKEINLRKLFLEDTFIIIYSSIKKIKFCWKKSWFLNCNFVKKKKLNINQFGFILKIGISIFTILKFLTNFSYLETTKVINFSENFWNSNNSIDLKNFLSEFVFNKFVVYKFFFDSIKICFFFLHFVSV